MTEARSERCYAAGYEDAGRGSRAKECGQPLKLEKARKNISP